MLTVYSCIVHEHDLRLVALAAVICMLASVTAINLLHHVRGTNGHMQKVWLLRFRNRDRLWRSGPPISSRCWPSRRDFQQLTISR